MDVALVVARLVLAGVFFVAGVAKLGDLRGSREALAGFGVPTRVAALAGTLLPFAELVVAGLLLFGATARAGGVGALSLLVLFAVGIATSMARGRAPDCHCFGQLHSEPAGARTLARNLLLAAIAAFAALAGDSPGPGVSEGVAELDGAEWLAVAAALVLLLALGSGTAAVLGLLRQNGRLLLRIEALEAALHARGIAIPRPMQPGLDYGLPVGVPAPGFALTGLDGEEVTLGSLLAAGRPVLLIFTDPGCGSCRQLLPQVGRWQRSRADELVIAVVSGGVSEGVRTEAAEHGLRTVLVDEDGAASSAYRAALTPSAVLIAQEGTIASPVAAGERAIAVLVGDRVVSPGDVSL